MMVLGSWPRSACWWRNSGEGRLSCVPARERPASSYVPPLPELCAAGAIEVSVDSREKIFWDAE